MNDGYLTIDSQIETEIIINKSRFWQKPINKRLEHATAILKI